MSHSLLAPQPFKPGVALPIALGLHAAMALGILLAAKFAPESGPMIDPDEVLTIQGKDVAARAAATDHKVQLTSMK